MDKRDRPKADLKWAHLQALGLFIALLPTLLVSVDGWVFAGVYFWAGLGLIVFSTAQRYKETHPKGLQ